LFVNFDASSSTDSDGHISGYSWSFGDGGSATGVAASHTYAAAGYYVATLTVRDETGGTDSVTHSVSVASPASVAIAVSAQQLLDEYDANEVAAQLKYQNKQVAVSGYIDSINVNTFTGEPYVNLVGSPDEWTLSWVRCTFPLSAQATLATLHEGDYVTIIGTCEDYFLGDVMVDDCHF
jgi:PKD repeat protein